MTLQKLHMTTIGTYTLDLQELILSHDSIITTMITISSSFLQAPMVYYFHFFNQKELRKNQLKSFNVKSTRIVCSCRALGDKKLNGIANCSKLWHSNFKFDRKNIESDAKSQLKQKMNSYRKQ